MRPEQQLVLDTIAEGEAPGYDVLYGGHKFKSFARHPGIEVPIGKTGFKSTAAGRYQMLKKTWEAQAHELGLKDFSPASQDAAAWNLAEETYLRATGRDLERDAAAGQVQWKALVNQWPSLERLAKGQAEVSAPAEQPELGKPYEPPILHQLPLGGPSLTPVDHDPFNPATGAKSSL